MPLPMLQNVVLSVVLIAAIDVRAETIPGDAFRSATGHWEGELYYLDYGSGQRFGIPMQATIELTEDGATLIRRLVYTDPGTKVHAVTLTTVDPNTGELVEAFFRGGNAELLRFTITEFKYTSATQWKLVYEQDGTDDNRPARIRQTLEREGDRMLSRKAVRFADDSEFLERNGSELSRSDTREDADSSP